MSSSRPYKVGIPAPVSQTIVADDRVQSTLDLPPILPAEQMSGLLQAELGRRHFSPNADGNMERERDGIKLVVDPDSGTLTVSAEGDDQHKPPPPGKPSPCTCRYQQAVREAQASLTAAQSRLQQAITDRLEASLGRVGCEMEGICHAVLVEALKAKAAQLGVVTKIEEDRKAGAITITVAVAEA